MRLWMNVLVAASLLALPLGVLPAAAEHESKPKSTTEQVQDGARKIGEGVEEAAKSVGKAVAEGARTAGEKLKESEKAAEPHAKSAWQNFRDGAVAFGQSVKSFFGRLFSD